MICDRLHPNARAKSAYERPADSIASASDSKVATINRSCSYSRRASDDAVCRLVHSLLRIRSLSREELLSVRFGTINILSSVRVPLLPNAKGEHDATSRREKAEQANLKALEFPDVVRALDLLEFLGVADLAETAEPFEQGVELATITRSQRIGGCPEVNIYINAQATNFLSDANRLGSLIALTTSHNGVEKLACRAVHGFSLNHPATSVL
ncbi:MAG TPA: hypothetical protein VF118_10705 [Gemmatimonadaceae bacterium]